MIASNYVDKLKRYFWFSNAELRSFVITVFVLGFVVSFDEWGGEVFDFAFGFANFLKAIAFVALALFIHHAGQRLWGLYKGFRVEQKLWWYGLLISVLGVIISNGLFVFLGASSTLIHHMPKHRFGRFRYGPNLHEYAGICLAGPLANVFLASFLVILSWIHLFPVTLADSLFTFNLIFAAWNLLPIPPLDGSRVMYYSRLVYIFFTAAIGSYAIMAYMFDFYSYIYAVIIGIIVWLIYLLAVERNI
ncbi:hypothetical protein KY329_03690 [Candidatus Woesearchaeota archaeon]|nr:hypothetical protein [Candidatus Woesearchaeota archaeon]